MFEKILQDLEPHHRSKLGLLKYYITLRLNKSTSNYYKDLISSYGALKYYDEFKVMKKIVRGK